MHEREDLKGGKAKKSGSLWTRTIKKMRKPVGQTPRREGGVADRRKNFEGWFQKLGEEPFKWVAEGITWRSRGSQSSVQRKKTNGARPAQLRLKKQPD